MLSVPSDIVLMQTDNLPGSLWKWQPIATSSEVAAAARRGPASTGKGQGRSPWQGWRW